MTSTNQRTLQLRRHPEELVQVIGAEVLQLHDAAAAVAPAARPRLLLQLRHRHSGRVGAALALRLPPRFEIVHAVVRRRGELLLPPTRALGVPPLQREDGGTAVARARARERERAQRLPHALDGEVEDGAVAARGEGGLVVGERGGLGGIEGAEPHAGAPPRRVPDLGGELAPGTLAHPDEGRRLPLLARRRGARVRPPLLPRRARRQWLDCRVRGRRGRGREPLGALLGGVRVEEEGVELQQHVVGAERERRCWCCGGVVDVGGREGVIPLLHLEELCCGLWQVSVLELEEG
jgi:hypothetical protein